MTYRFKETPIGKTWRGCAPRAYSILEGCADEEARRVLKAAGRDGKGTTPQEIDRVMAMGRNQYKRHDVADGIAWDAKNSRFTIERKLVGERRRITAPTLNQWVKANPNATGLLCLNGHAVAIVDGVVHDHTDSKRRQVLMFYEMPTWKREAVELPAQEHQIAMRMEW